MRYVVAMLLAIACAAVTTLYVSSPIATWITSKMRYDNPDSVADLHSAIFIGINILALVIGWAIGWAASGAFERAEPEI